MMLSSLRQSLSGNQRSRCALGIGKGVALPAEEVVHGDRAVGVCFKGFHG